MKKKRNPAVYLLFVIFLFCIAGVSFISYRTYQKMLSVEKTLDTLSEQLDLQKEILYEKEALFEEFSTSDTSVPEPDSLPETASPDSSNFEESPISPSDNSEHKAVA